MGHIRDLPKSKLGVDVDNDFEETYESLASRKKVIKELKDAAKDATDIYVATDPDREGEAIGWHITQELAGKKRKFHRLTFNEITKKAVQEALNHPRAIDVKMVAAQRARRVLDRLVGYKISPLLWDKVRRGLSAGRVQSVALKLVCDRERAIEAFVPEEYWNLFARLAGPQPPEFDAKLLKKNGDTIKVGNEEQSKAILADLERAEWIVASVTTKERKRNAPPPFITSKLQQTARFPVKKTMMIAQQLYEGGIEIPDLTGGLITYMRTDSVRVADEAVAAVREYIRTTFGDDYLPEKPNVYKTKSDAQDAHEAIRPTSLQHDPETVRQYLTPGSVLALPVDLEPVRRLADAARDVRRDDGRHRGRTVRVPRQGTVPKFAGWMATYGLTPGEPEQKEPAAGGDDGRVRESTPEREGEDDAAVSGVLPPLAEGDRLEMKALRPEQKFTQPPPRFSEATLVKELEENGIGRPSTYASIISVLQDREYAIKNEGRFKPTLLGTMITELLTKSFDDIIDVEYTRNLEDDLDKIEEGKTDYVQHAHELLQEVQEGSLAGRQGDDRSQEGDRDRRSLRQVRLADAQAGRQVRPLHRLQRLSGVHEHARARNERARIGVGRGRDRAVRELRQADGDEARTLRPVPRLHRLPRVQDDAQADRHQAGRAARGEGGSDSRREVPALRRPTSSSSRAASASSRRARIIPSASTSSTRRPASSVPKDADKGGEVVERKSKRGKTFFGCSNYPDCDFVLWNRPINEPCPKCGAPYLVEKTTKKLGRQVLCNNEECDYARSEALPETPETAA